MDDIENKGYQLCTLLGEGNHKCKNGGWVEVKKSGYGWETFWTSDRDSHCRAFGLKAIMVTYVSETKVTSIFESAINMWMVREMEDKVRVVNRMDLKLNGALEELKTEECCEEIDQVMEEKVSPIKRILDFFWD